MHAEDRSRLDEKRVGHDKNTRGSAAEARQDEQQALACRDADTQRVAGAGKDRPAFSSAPRPVNTNDPAPAKPGDSILTVTGYIINRERIELSPRFMGTESFGAQPDSDDWQSPIADEAEQEWNNLRSAPQASWIGATGCLL